MVSEHYPDSGVRVLKTLITKMADVTIAEEPVTIAEEPVTIAEEPVTIAEEPVTIAPVSPEAKRKPGRPVGSKSKEPGKPRKPRAKKVVEVREEQTEYVEAESVEAKQEELPRATPGSIPIPEEAYDLRSAKMLRLLQMQRDHRKEQKRSMYSSWFR